MSECEEISVEEKCWVKTVIRPGSLWRVEKLEKGVEKGNMWSKVYPLMLYLLDPTASTKQVRLCSLDTRGRNML